MTKRQHLTFPQRVQLRDYVLQHYVVSGLDDGQFARAAAKALGFPCKGSHVLYTRTLEGLANNYKERARVVREGLEARRAARPARRPKATASTPPAAVKSDIDTLVNLLATVESRLAMIENDLRGLRREVGSQRIGAIGYPAPASADFPKAFVAQYAHANGAAR